MRYSLLALTALASFVVAQDPPCTPSDPVLICQQRAAFGGSLVVPEIIPSFLPVGVLHLIYGTVDVGGAQQLAPNRVGNTPVISFDNVIPGSNSGPLYTLVMLDYDSTVPSVLHWMQTDLTVQATTNLLTSNVAPAAQYAGPAPPQGSGVHRYVALLYTQPPSFSLPAAYRNMPTRPMAGSARLQFVLANFLRDAGLGAPVGGNFFKSTYDGSTGTNTVVAATGAIPGATGGAAAGGSSTAMSVASGSTRASASSTTGAAASVASATSAGASSLAAATTTARPASGAVMGVSTAFATWTFGIGSALAVLELVAM